MEVIEILLLLLQLYKVRERDRRSKITALMGRN